MAKTFYPIDPVEVTPGTPGSWIDVDVSTYVPSGATGVLLHLVHVSTPYAYDLGLRKNGSTDNRVVDGGDASHSWGAIGIDGNRIFECYVESITGIDVYLVGYTMAGVTFFTNAYDKSLSTTLAWVDINCATEAPNALGLIWEIVGLAQMGLRKNGSTDNRIQWVLGHYAFGAIVGCDASQIIEGYISLTSSDFFLVGYITEGATFNTNQTMLSISLSTSWLDFPALPAGANMGFIEVLNNAISNQNFALRKKGSSEEIYYRATQHVWAFVECDANGIIQYKEGGTNDYAYGLVGYADKTSVYPSDPSTRVTGIIHRYSSQAGKLTMEVLLGGATYGSLSTLSLKPPTLPEITQVPPSLADWITGQVPPAPGASALTQQLIEALQPMQLKNAGPFMNIETGKEYWVTPEGKKVYSEDSK